MASLQETFSAKERKQNGVHYTPNILADFVATSIVNAWLKENKTSDCLRVIDPAVGSGELLLSLLKELSNKNLQAESVFAFDTSKEAILCSTERIIPYCLKNSFQPKIEDFLEFALGYEYNLFNALFKRDNTLFDLVIANPPYVRTQNLGAKESQRVSERFDLSGRVDLYQAFIKGIGLVLKPKGIAGIIVSNRFMSTKGGHSIREAIKEVFDIIHVWDLGDTKLFEAAVLPAILLLRKKEKKKYNHTPCFSTIYSMPTKDSPINTIVVPDAIQALSYEGVVDVKGELYLVQHGILESKNVWRLSNAKADNWLEQVKKMTFCTFGDIGKIAVGVKTTADKVFIRSDWDSFPQKPVLLKPLITHHKARRFKASELTKKREILYPHTISKGVRCVIDLDKYPNDKAYLESHRMVLESRKYLIDAGRRWYEIWVPQAPNAWSRPKIVFRDISEKPEFWIDLDGSVVNGDCYWLCAKSDKDLDFLWLILAVGNSSFIEHFYDRSFNNKLYSGRRRFMTQYVQKFPLPSLATKLVKEMISLAKKIYEKLPKEDTTILEKELDSLVWESFGLSCKEVSG